MDQMTDLGKFCFLLWFNFPGSAKCPQLKHWDPSLYLQAVRMIVKLEYTGGT